jgi:hypothetical protein
MNLVAIILILTLIVLIAIKEKKVATLYFAVVLEFMVISYAVLWSFIAWLLHWGSNR